MTLSELLATSWAICLAFDECDGLDRPTIGQSRC